MRSWFLILFLMVYPNVALAQSSDQAETSVATLFRQVSSGYITGNAEKPVNRLGDAAAVALTKIFADRTPDAKDVETMLVVFREAFGRPTIVVIEADRQPRTTLFLLKYFDSLTFDTELKIKIAEVRRFVVEQRASLSGAAAN